jgi:nicotinate-nucleotide pyrophosphorylase (carboxylating)
MTTLPDLIVDPIIRAALAEDLGAAGDITSQACIPAGTQLTTVIVARREGRIAGLDCARLAFQAVGGCTYEALAADGQDVAAGAVLARISGEARAILTAERTALNFLQRLSGVATLTRTYVRAVAHTGAAITDTRKTTPGLRALEKLAVRLGGARNHRFGLNDAVLIKDNHVAACGGVGPAVRAARAAVGHLVQVEVEVDRLDQLAEALAERPDVIMLDNFSLADMAAAVAIAKGRVVLEASGGVDLSTVAAIAETGVDVISVGALTHSAPILDVGLDAV